jgi:hypothetical protein
MIIWRGKVYFGNVMPKEQVVHLTKVPFCRRIGMKKLGLSSLAAMLIAGCCTVYTIGPGFISAQGPVESKRLILKDGSYQIVSKWEVHGNRVRYYSTERYDWEEMPNSLVDWAATEKYNSQVVKRPSISSADVAAVDAEEQAERAKEEAKTPTVAPGIKLPDTGGVFLLDSYHNKPALVELVQNGGELNKQTGKNIMRAIINPLPTGARQSIELKGPRARVQTHNSFPNIYVDIDNSDTDSQDSEQRSNAQPAIGPNGIGSAPAQKPNSDSTKAGSANGKLNQPDRFKIVRVQTKKDSRVVSNVKISLLGKVSNEEDVIPTTAEPVHGGDWVKVIPSKPLVPGEYALVEMLGEKQINMYVWDFGYDPNAPANPTAWKPQQPQSTDTGSNETPILTKRPK